MPPLSLQLSRRQFIQYSAASCAGSLLYPGPTSLDSISQTEYQIASQVEKGSQRLSIEKLQKWEKLGYGMFLHFSMNTYDGDEYSKGDKPATYYNPTKLDVDQWISVARDAGMKYAVLTTKHVPGFCLWPSKYTDYHVGNSGNHTDVVGKFVKACEAKGVLPAFYYCSWDNHHLMGSLTPSATRFSDAYTTTAYREFQWKQLEELALNYGNVVEWWIDIPGVLPRDYRNDLYRFLSDKQPESVVIMNHGLGDGSTFNIDYAWPTDVITIERFLPNSATKHERWRDIEGKRYYLPGEVCDPIGKEWFYKEGDQPRSDEELLGMYLICRSRGTNLLLDVPPDRSGVIPSNYVRSLMQLRKNIDKMGM